MSKAARNRCPGGGSFVVCFYCNENFRSLTALFKHSCTIEEKISLDSESNETFSDPNIVDLSQCDWEINSVDLSQPDLESHDIVSVTNDCDLGKENSVSESHASNVSENLLPERECKQLSSELNPESIAAKEEITYLSSIVPEKQLLEANMNEVRDEITCVDSVESEKQPMEAISDTIKGVSDLAIDASKKLSPESSLDAVKDVNNQSPDSLEKQVSLVSSGTESVESEKRPLETILDAVKKVSDLAFDLSKKQSNESSLDAVKDINNQSSDSLEKQVSLVNSGTESEKRPLETILDAVKEVSDLAFDASKKQSPEASLNAVKEKQVSVASSGMGKSITEMEPNADDELNRTFPDLVSKILQYYEKETKQGTSDSCCKSPATDIEFHSSSSPLLTEESSSLRHDNEQMESSAADVGNKSLSSSTICDTFGEKIIESDALKKTAIDLESHDSNICSRPSSPELDSSDMFSISSSVEMDLDNFSDDQAQSKDFCNALSGKMPSELKHDHKHPELHDSEINNELLPEEIFNIKHGSMILKPCYVMIQDIFKSNSKLSPKNIFSKQKKYHVCDVCFKFFRLKSDLNTHYLIHTSVKPFVCSKCGKSFVKQSSLFAHHLAHTIIKNYACSVCKRTFPKRDLLIKHKLNHTHLKRFACDKCDKSYSVKSSLKEHYLSHSREKPFICEICNASFNNRRYLRKHYFKHQRKDYVCKICSKTFKNKHHFDEHRNIHANDKPNKCKICGRSFHLLLTLNKHFSVAHRNERDLLFQEKLKALVEIMNKNETIKKSTIINKGDKTPVKKMEKSTIGEKTPDKKIVKLSVDISKETVPCRTRRKSFYPKKYLQPDEFVLY